MELWYLNSSNINLLLNKSFCSKINVGDDSMLILTKSVLAMMIGFIIAMIFGYLLIPILKKMKVKQNVSEYLS